MLPPGQRIAFLLFAFITVTLGARGFYRLYRRVIRGRKDTDARTNRLGRRAWYALKTTILQGRVLRDRPVVSVFHAFIFYAFVLYLFVNLLDAIEGFVDLGPLAPDGVRTVYGWFADLFSLLAVIGVVALVLRRFLTPARRDFSFNQLTLLDEKVRAGYIQRDSLIVSVFILFHVGSRVIGHAATGPHAMAWRIFGYWGALGSVLLFLIYFPYSKHVHLLVAPLKYLFRRDASSGELPAIKIDLDADNPEIGAAQLADLAWPRLLDAYACIQCNRCQDVCPASHTGKALSPAALEINKRMVLNTMALERGASPGPRLIDTVISAEAVWACTTCGACMEACPTQDEQMLDIIDIRRNLVMQEGDFPAQLQSAFRGMQRNSNPWGIARDKRMDWAESLDVPTIDKTSSPDVLYLVGCAASYDPGAQKTARAVVQLLTKAKVNFAVLGKRECCTGDPARRAGNELLYQELAAAAIQTLNEARPKLLLASCPHCVNIIANEYPQLGGRFAVMHHSEYLDSLVKEGKLAPARAQATITFHDPCYLGRHRGSYEQPRSMLKVLTSDYVELPRAKSNAFCCGAGGAQFWKEEERGTERISENRFHEIQATLDAANNGKVLAVGCPFCKSMLQSTPSAADDRSIAIKDVAELLWEGVQRARGEATIPLAAPASVERPAEAQPEASAPVVREVTATATQQPPVVEPGPAATPTERKKWAPKPKT